MHPGHGIRRLSPLLGLAVVVTAMLFAPRAARAQDEAPVFAKDSPAVKQAEVEFMWTGARRHFQNAAREATRTKAKKRGQRSREAFDEDALLRPGVRAARAEIGPLSGQPIGPFAQPTTVPVSSRVGDGANAGQAEESIAMLGNLGMCAWNDGQGFITGGDVQGVGYTTNGGVSWTDVGTPPKAGATGGAIGRWTSDPVVALNEKTGEFYYCGLINGTASNNGIGVVRATFPGGVFTWDTPRVVNLGPNATEFHDKEWLVADSTNGNLYLSYTRFYIGGDEILFRRSTDNGLTWSAPIKINDPVSDGLVQGSRPVVGPNGELYVVWREIGLVDVDYLRVRKSTNAGVSFDVAINQVAAYYDNFGTGAPGFNRERSVIEPCPAVDRSMGTNRGRLYVSWHESVNWYDDGLGGGGARSEVENNNFFARANSFTPGQRLRGSLGSTTDLDYWSFSATAGTDYIFWCDSIPRPLYTMRIFCSDTTGAGTRLAFAGDLNAPAGSNGFIVWTAPFNGTFYMRMAYVAGGTGTGGYRIQTGVNGGGPERGRDQRDVFVAYSDNMGSAWSTPTRVNDDAALYDGWLPEVAVPCDGNPYVFWYDWRDASSTCHGSSHCYLSRSLDGGNTWAANQRITTALTHWTTTGTNIAPNQGDYVGLYGGDQLALSWADGRLPESPDVDVWGARVLVNASVACPPDTTVFSGTKLSIDFTVNNPDVVFDNSYDYTLTANRSWPGLPAGGGPVAVTAGGSTAVNFSIQIPDSAANGDVLLCFMVESPNGAKKDTCYVTLHVINPVTAVLASLLQASADDGVVRLAWSLGTGGGATLYRSADGHSWVALALLHAEGSGVVTYEDADVVRGQRYGYRLGIPQAGGEVTAGEIWVQVPEAAAFALYGARPNPAVGALSVSFALPSGAPARLEILDVTGRRVFQREVGSMGSGFHVVPIDRDTHVMPAGIYTVRLVQGARVLTTRIAFVR